MQERVRWAVNCKRQDSAVTEIVHYNEHGKIVSSVKGPRNLWKFEKQSRKSVGGVHIELVCEWAT